MNLAAPRRGIGFVALTLLSVLVACAPRPGRVHIEQGVIHLPTAPASLARGDLVSLQGPWEFYWGRLINPADFRAGAAPPATATIGTMRPWTVNQGSDGSRSPVGFATYRMRVRLPVSGEPFGLWFPHQFSAARVFVDGVLLAEVGSIGQEPEETVPNRQDTMVAFTPRGPETELIFHIANGWFFRGGMRGQLLFGHEAAVRRFVTRRSIFEACVLGLVLGAAFYHLFFFFLHRAESSFLFFSLLCFLLALRIPLQASKSYALFVGDLSWATQARILGVLNIVTMPIGALFLRSIFPGMVSRRVVSFYLLAAFLGFGPLFAGLRVLSLGSFVYVAILLPVLVVHAFYLLFQAFREGRSSLLMGVAFVALGFFGGTALVLNYRGHEGGEYVITGYLLFVLLQALALSRFFLNAVQARASLSERLRHSMLALSQQRKELQVNLHDSLGGALTDLQIHTEQEMAAAGSEPVLARIHDRIAETVQMFRSQLLFMEDLELTAQDLLPGIQMTLLRRYADAGREIDFDVSDPLLRAIGEQGDRLVPVKLTLDLFFLAVELCTNDLKYGQGESLWRFSLEDQMLYILQRNEIRDPGSDSQEPQLIRPVRAGERVAKLGGSLQATALRRRYSIEVRLPLGNQPPMFK